MPVGTYGTVKGVMPRSLRRDGRADHPGQHLPPVDASRPGRDGELRRPAPVREVGQARSSPTRGGFQVWWLGAMRKISEEGVKFASPVNGDKLFLTPEVSMQIQTILEQRHRHAVRRVHALRHQGPPDDRARGAHLDGAEPALGQALPGRVRAPGKSRTRCSASCRAACSRTCARNRWRTGGAGLPRLRHRRRERGRAQGRRCCASWRTRRNACRRTSRAT